MLQYDRNLQQDQVTSVHQLMRKLELWPSAHIGEHIGDPATLIDYFLINARELGVDPIAWTKQFSVISLGSDIETTKLAVLQPDGSYRKEYIAQFLQKPLSISKDNPRYGEILSIVVTPHIAIYGIQLRSPDADQTHNSESIVVWLDISSPTWKVIRIKKGLLARHIEDY